MSLQEVPWQFAILCVITQSFRWVLELSPAATRCCNQSDSNFESPAAIAIVAAESGAGAGAASAEALILHWQSGILALVLILAPATVFELPLRTCDELCPRNGSCKNANAAQSKHRGNIWCLAPAAGCFYFSALLPLGLANQWHGTDYSIAYLD